MKSFMLAFAVLCLPILLKAQTVGIGTTTPNANSLLHLDVGSQSTKGLLVTGAYGSGSVPDLGTGSRLMFYPGRVAFRAGVAYGTSWDNINVGTYSIAMGEDAVASGSRSTAFGSLTKASGLYSTAFGGGTDAIDAYCTAMGGFTLSRGWYSTAMNLSTVAGGRASTAMGISTTAKGYGSTTLGMYNDSLLVADETAVSSTTPLFIVGNGNSGNSRSNALVVRKDGNVGIGNIVPEFTLDVANRMRLRSGGTNFTSPGIWFNNLTNTHQIAFLGVSDDNTVGIFGSLGASWNLNMNVATGNVGIGTVSPSQKLHVIGNICYTGSSAACSDIRYKTALQPLNSVLASVLNIQPIYYYWKPEYRNKGFTMDRQLGFSAQEIEQYFPEVVQTDNEGYKAVDYSRLTPVLLQAIKEQQQQLQEQQTIIKTLQNKLAADHDKLQSVLTRLESIEKKMASGENK